MSTELDSAGLEALGRGKGDFVDEGEIVAVEVDDRDGRGMCVGRCDLAVENTRLDGDNRGDSARRGRL